MRGGDGDLDFVGGGAETECRQWRLSVLMLAVAVRVVVVVAARAPALSSSTGSRPAASCWSPAAASAGVAWALLSCALSLLAWCLLLLVRLWAWSCCLLLPSARTGSAPLGSLDAFMGLGFEKAISGRGGVPGT